MRNSRLTGDGNSTETQAGLHIQHILNVMVRGKDDRIGNKAVFMTLHGTDHGSLRRRWLIVVYNADAAQELHVAKVYVRTVTIKLAGGCIPPSK